MVAINQWLTCFQDIAGVVLGTDAQELGRMRDTDEAGFDEVFQKANFRDFIFKIRAKKDVFNVSDNDSNAVDCLAASLVAYLHVCLFVFLRITKASYVMQTRKCVHTGR